MKVNLYGIFRVQNGSPLKSAALFGRTPRTCLRLALIVDFNANFYVYCFNFFADEETPANDLHDSLLLQNVEVNNCKVEIEEKELVKLRAETENLTGERDDLKARVTQLESAKLNSDVALQAAEVRKQELDTLAAELMKERDSLKDRVTQLESVKLNSDVALQAVEEKLKRRQEELDNLAAELQKLTKERERLKDRVAQLERERLEADLHAVEKINKVNTELACKEVELQHANQLITELRSRYREAESMRQVDSATNVALLKKINAELWRKCEKIDQQLLNAHFGDHGEGPGKSKTQHPGNYLTMIQTGNNLLLCDIVICVRSCVCVCSENDFVSAILWYIQG